jgi:hypothetical protein
MELHFKIVGVLLIFLALIHALFPTYFNWKQELRSLSLINRQVMYVHTLFIALGISLMGLLCLTSSHELSTTILGKRISLGLGVFWIVRLLVQFFGYSPQLWRGLTFETAIHILFSVLWAYLTAVFIFAYLT